MTTDIDRFIATAPQLKYAFSVKVKVGPLQDLGQIVRADGTIEVVARYTIRARSVRKLIPEARVHAVELAQERRPVEQAKGTARLGLVVDIGPFDHVGRHVD